MAFYQLSGQRIETDAPLAWVHADEGPAAQVVDGALIHFRVGVPGPVASPGVWLLSRTGSDSEPPSLSIARTRDGYLLRVHGHADFLVDRAGDSILAAPFSGCDRGTLEQLLVDQILPQVLHLRGQLSLHASAVALGDGGVLAFAGPSGAGKSTLATRLGLRGALVSDDCLALEPYSGGVTVLPSYAATRLCTDAAAALVPLDRAVRPASPRTNKLVVELPRPTGPLRLRRLYLLARSEEPPTVVRLSQRDALGALAGFVHRLDPDDRQRLVGELARLCEVVSRVPVARLSYRRSFADLDRVVEAIDADAAAD